VSDVMRGQSFTPVTGAERLLELHAAELPQKDELCGAFWGTLALRSAGVDGSDGSVDQDAVGAAAGSVLSAIPSDVLPEGESGRRDYRLSFPTVDDSDTSGTSAAGLVRAVSELSSGSVQAIPLSGPWTRASVTAVLEAASGCSEPCTPIANVATRYFWGSRTSPATALAYLMSGDSDAGPPPDWDVGHFVGLLGRIDGPRGTLVIVADTYRSLGWEGLHLQPIERLAAALARADSGLPPKGVVLVAGADDASDVERRLRAEGLEIATWDNGSLDMANAAR
jgi:hypothetical protein